MMKVITPLFVMEDAMLAQAGSRRKQGSQYRSKQRNRKSTVPSQRLAGSELGL